MPRLAIAELFVEPKAELNRYLPIIYFAIFYVSAAFNDLKPTQIVKRLGGLGNRVVNGILDAGFG
jgi:hypothetical protein